MSPKTDELYKELIERCKEISLINGCQALLGWDEQTYMPPGGAKTRSEQSAYLSGLAHQKATDPRIGELLSELEQTEFVKDEYSDTGANIREIRYDYDKLTKLPQKLVEEISRTATLSQAAWIQARKENDYPKFLPWMEKVIKLVSEKAECFGYEKEKYDALLDEFEPGSSVDFVSSTFSEFRDELVNLVAAIAESPKKPDLSILERAFAVDRQKIFGQEIAVAIGYRYDIGRLDISAHPFTTGMGPGDTRITTRYNPQHFGQALFGIMHEAGHGIYDQNLDENHFGTPLGDSCSLGIHESQSRMWENQVGRGKPFWKHFFPRAQQVYPEELGNVAFDDFFFAINDVRPSLIRVEADEVTYNLHILLRFELEHAIINGDVTAKDLPGAWNEKFKKYFNMTPPTDADGCMQDVHWPSGYFGYFPTYTLGNLYSAQFFAKANEEIPNLEKQFEVGQFSDLRNWLTKNIHTPGRRYRANKLCEVVTGKPLSAKPLMDYLNKKFGELYNL